LTKSSFWAKIKVSHSGKKELRAGFLSGQRLGFCLIGRLKNMNDKNEVVIKGKRKDVI